MLKSFNSLDEHYIHCQPVCRSCQSDLQSKNDTDLICLNPVCKNHRKNFELSHTIDLTKKVVILMWEGYERKKEKSQWLNFDQELMKLAESEDKDDEKFWCKTKILKTKEGKVVMILLGKKGHNSKVQFFVKDELNQVTFDQIGDINPQEILIAFKAQFSDGSITETIYKK